MNIGAWICSNATPRFIQPSLDSLELVIPLPPLNYKSVVKTHPLRVRGAHSPDLLVSRLAPSLHLCRLLETPQRRLCRLCRLFHGL